MALAILLKRQLGINKTLLGVGSYPLTPALALKNIFETVVLLQDSANDIPTFRDRLRAMVERYRPEFMAPGVDAEVAVLSSLAGELAGLGVRTLLPKAVDVARVSKVGLCEAGQEAPFAVGSSWVVSEVAEVGRLGFPVVVKGAICDSYVVGCASESAVVLGRISAIWGLPAVAQEYLDGDEYAICVVAGPMPGRIAGAVAIKKMGVTGKGKTWLGATIENGELTDIARTVVKHFNWLGPMEIELRHVPGRGFVVFEINPRFPAWLGWLDDDAYGMGQLFLDLLLGREPRNLTIPSGRVGIRINRYVTFPMTRVIQLASTGRVEL